MMNNSPSNTSTPDLVENELIYEPDKGDERPVVDGIPVNSEDLLALAVITESEAPHIDNARLEETTDLLNVDLHSESSITTVRQSNALRTRSLINGVKNVYRKLNAPRLSEKKPELIGREDSKYQDIYGYDTTNREVEDLYMDLRQRVLNDSSPDFDTTLCAANMAIRLGDVGFMGLALEKLNELGVQNGNLGLLTQELYFDTLALAVNKIQELDAEARQKLEPTINDAIEMLKNPHNLKFDELPESIWPFIDAVGKTIGTEQQKNIVGSLLYFAMTVPDRDKPGVRRKFNHHGTNPYSREDRHNSHLYKGYIVQNGSRQSWESLVAYRDADGVRGGLIPKGKMDAPTPHLLTDLWYKLNDNSTIT